MKLSAGKDKSKLIFRGKLLWPSSLHPRVSVTSVIYYRAGVGFSPIYWAWVFKFQQAPLTTSAQGLTSFDHLGEQHSTQGGTVCTSQHAPRNVIKNIQIRSLFENDTFKIWAFSTPRTDPADLPYPCQSLQPFLENRGGRFSNILVFPKITPVKPVVSDNSYPVSSVGIKNCGISFHNSVGTTE